MELDESATPHQLRYTRCSYFVETVRSKNPHKGSKLPFHEHKSSSSFYKTSACSLPSTYWRCLSRPRQNYSRLSNYSPRSIFSYCFQLSSWINTRLILVQMYKCTYTVYYRVRYTKRYKFQIKLHPVRGGSRRGTAEPAKANFSAAYIRKYKMKASPPAQLTLTSENNIRTLTPRVQKISAPAKW